MKSIDSLGALMEQELRDIYNAEEQLVEALPKLAKMASSSELKQVLETHLNETQEQIKRLEKVFASMEIPVKGKKCDGMKGIIDEGKKVAKEDMEDSVKDAAIIAAVQKSEHYEIATYGCLATWAKLLGFQEAAGLLVESLNEEEAADEKLTEIAEETVNAQAAVAETASAGR